jgi:4-aminobutyrate aminotransferase/(S)-3-amino-2-methylpropionate transaminase
MESISAIETLKKLRQTFVAQGYVSAADCYVARAKGALIWDIEGREFIDFSGGIGVMNVGHSHPKVVAAIKEQAEKFTHTCFMVVPYASAVELAEKICALVPGSFLKKAFFVNSGAEAVENAVKVARYASGKPGIVAFENGYHGRTLLSMTLTSKVKPYKFGFGPFAPEIYRMPFAYCYRCPVGLEYPRCGIDCAERLRDFFISYADAEHIAAVIFEPVQGEGGFIVPPKEYFSKLSSICKENGILTIADEIQSGMGRTGAMFAIEHFGVDPDIVTVAKSLAAGMPLSAVVGRGDLMDKVHAGGLGGTYGANPVACRAALAVLEIFDEENLLVKAKALGVTLEKRLSDWKQRYEIIGDVRGLGPMRALELVKDRGSKVPAPEETRKLVKFCAERGLVVLSCGTFGNVIRLLMPLVISDAQLDKGLAVLEEGISKVLGQ